MRIRLPLLALAGGTAVAAVLAVSADRALGIDKKVPGPDPWAGFTDAEKQAQVDEAHAANDRFLANFVAEHRDPRTLRVVEVENYAGPSAGTLEEAVRESEVIIQGKVLKVGFESAQGGGMPLSTSSVEVADSLVGDAQSAIKVFQEGGPVAQGDGGALAQLDVDPILMPGDSVILFLTYDAKLGAYRTVAGVGIYVIEPDGTVRAQEGNPFRDKIDGLRTAQFILMLTAEN